MASSHPRSEVRAITALNASYDRTRPLISIHVPKCAGTSFRAVLAHWFGKGLLEHYADEKRGSAPTRHDLTRPRPGPVCIHGHFNHRRGFGTEAYYPQVSQFIAIVREPFDLHLSNYFYARRLIDNGKLFRDGGARDPADFASIESYLARRRRSLLPSFFPASLTPRTAADHLSERFLYIGVVDDIDYSVGALASVLGFPNPGIAHSNAAERSEAVPEGLRERFRDENALAYAIYDYAAATYRSVPAAARTAV
ncbi:MAG: sulfotransferase family 2 domain-containing protein [Hyphomicrobiaceae bacterium]|nr:sulfotransferase family 2 domain-containing protein [Hyphomicrobiaceae bacterium]